MNKPRLRALIKGLRRPQSESEPDTDAAVLSPPLAIFRSQCVAGAVAVAVTAS